MSAYPARCLIDGHQHACLSERFYSSFIHDNLTHPVNDFLHICPNQDIDISDCSPLGLPSAALLSAEASQSGTVGYFYSTLQMMANQFTSRIHIL